MKWSVLAGLVLAFPPLSLEAAAAVTEKDLQVTARALSFMASPFKGVTRVGIVYDPADSRSQSQAESVRQMLDGGLQAGQVVLVPVLVPLAQAARAEVDLFFLTEYLGERAAPLREVMHRRRFPCVTVDLEQVRSGACVMGVQSSPKVQILINRAAAESGGIQFANVFRMMIVEI